MFEDFIHINAYFTRFLRINLFRFLAEITQQRGDSKLPANKNLQAYILVYLLSPIWKRGFCNKYLRSRSEILFACGLTVHLHNFIENQMESESAGWHVNQFCDCIFMCCLNVKCLALGAATAAAILFSPRQIPQQQHKDSGAKFMYSF